MTKRIQLLSFVLCLFAYFFAPSSFAYGVMCPPDTGTNCTDWENSIYQTTTENPGCNLRAQLGARHWFHMARNSGYTCAEYPARESILQNTASGL